MKSYKTHKSSAIRTETRESIRASLSRSLLLFTTTIIKLLARIRLVNDRLDRLREHSNPRCLHICGFA